MDRFIDPMSNNIAKRVIDLKSNMDRFIGNLVNGIIVNSSTFKIQYG